MEPRDQERKRKRRELVRSTDLSTVGLVFPVAVVIGFFLGRWVGGLLGHERAGTLVGITLGILSGFYNLWKVTIQLKRQDERERAEADAAGRRWAETGMPDSGPGHDHDGGEAGATRHRRPEPESED